MSPYRLSLDIGTNSIGWCALQLEKQEGGDSPASILDMGVRIFQDGRNPKDGSSNAVKRRAARAMRRNRDRFLWRREQLIKALVEAGLMPEDESERRALTALDPYELRKRGLTDVLNAFEFGRAIFHLNQRRGFKSNRKQDSDVKEAGRIYDALKEQRAKMDEAGAHTFGEYLYLRREQGLTTRSKTYTREAVNKKGEPKQEPYYEFYPSRELLEHEFEMLWRVQAKHHPDLLTKDAHDRIHHIIFFQRPLKAQPVGKCLFEREEDRAPRAYPIVQRFRIYQELNHLSILDKRTLRGRPITLRERDMLATLLCEPRGLKKAPFQVTFDTMRKRLGLDDSHVFSHESERRKGLDGDVTSALMAHKDRFGARWCELEDAEQEAIIDAVRNENDEEALLQFLMQGWVLDRDHAQSVANVSLPPSHGNLGITATRKILEELTEDVIPYSLAVEKAGYKSHSIFDTGEAQERLPYYGAVLERHVIPDPAWHGDPRAPLEKKYGKVTNPTVHIALNQLRKVVNEVIKHHGKPEEIHVEVLRELKLSLREKKEVQEQQKKNQDANDACAARLRDEFHQRVNRENIQRLRLWSELGAGDQVCVYTGESISAENLFSDDVEIDHILPVSQTLDDSMANKILCKRRSNRDKGNRTPFAAWGHTEDWLDIQARSEILPPNKKWRFAKEAMQRYLKEHDFIARQLTDSQYIARLARAYLTVLFDPKKEHKVLCLPGRLTGLFRHHLGLESILDELNPAREESKAPRGEKNRNDHRHHAVDALIIGLMDRAFLQKAASISARLEKQGVYRMFDDFPEPWPHFHHTAKEALGQIVVSHKLDHGIEDALHNQTAYGFAKRPDSRGEAVHRVPASSIKASNIALIKGKRLRALLVAHLAGMSHDEAFENMEAIDKKGGRTAKTIIALCGGNEKDIAKRAPLFLQSQGIRRVRLIERIALESIRDRDGKVYKGVKPDGNAYLNVYREGDDPKWRGELVNKFRANSVTARVTASIPGGATNGRQLITRLFNWDMIEMEHNGARRIFYIQKMSEEQIALAEHFEANADSRTRDKTDPFRFVYKGNVGSLFAAKARLILVTPAGRIRYLSDPPDDTTSD